MPAPTGNGMTADELAAVTEAVEAVTDPEIPVLTIKDLGILRSVKAGENGEGVTVTITPTYSGCPAMDTIADDIRSAIEAAGSVGEIVTTFDPPWTTHWMSDEGRQKLNDYGIAPPACGAGTRVPVALGRITPAVAVDCPRCGSDQTERRSEFSSTACKAHYVCGSCFEPFDYFKEI